MHPRPLVLAAIALGMSAATPASAQLCLGRSLPGEFSLEVGAGVLGGVMGRASAGGELAFGLGGRVGVVLGLVDRDEWRPAGAHGEVFWAVPTEGSIHICPGVAGYRSARQVDERSTLFDIFTSLGFESQTATGATVVWFVTPRLAVSLNEEMHTVMPPDEPGVTRPVWTTEARAYPGITGGVGLLMGPLTLRGMATTLVPFPGVPPALGFTIGWRPGWKRGDPRGASGSAAPTPPAYSGTRRRRSGPPPRPTV